MNVPRLLLLTDRAQLPLGRPLLETLRTCADAGATHVVVRELDLPDAQRAALAAKLVGLGLAVIAAHRPLPGAVAVHLPATATTPSNPASCNAVLSPLNERYTAREATVTPRYMHRAGWWGRSCHSAAEVRRAVAEGATYATLSPFAASRSKPGHGPPVDRSAYAVDADIPVLALAGVTPESAGEARACGAYGVAVMGAVMRAADPGAVVARLLEEVGR